MTNTYSLPHEAAEISSETSATQSEPQEVEALVPASKPVELERPTLTPPMTRLPVELEVGVPARDFRVHTLVGLEQGQVIETQWEATGDLPLAAGDVQLAWSEFEVVDTRMAVRITRLA
jgi:flagellar motor switch protein FliN